MSKFDPLWEYVRNDGSTDLELTFDQIHDIVGIPIDHSFLQYKKELLPYGYEVGKISLKNQTVRFRKMA